MNAPRFYAVSDESQITASRFRSIAAVSLPVTSAAACNAALRDTLTQHQVGEFKWHNLSTAKRRFCAIALVDRLFDTLLVEGGRIDVLTWDTQDSRHCVKNRDDVKNFERMYFHLHKVLMRRRSPESMWHLRPDERLGIDWVTLQDCLSCAGAWRRYRDHPVLASEFSVSHFQVASLRQVRSCDLPLCQIADLFAGMAAFTRSRPDLVRSWLVQESGQQSLLVAEPALRYSNRERERLRVITYLNGRAKRLRLGVSLATAGYLQTKDPTNPVNFWHYAPQHHRDQAPTRST